MHVPSVGLEHRVVFLFTVCLHLCIPTCILILDPTDEDIDSASSNPDEADAASPQSEAAEDTITPGSQQLENCFIILLGYRGTSGYGGTHFLSDLLSNGYSGYKSGECVFSHNQQHVPILLIMRKTRNLQTLLVGE